MPRFPDILLCFHLHLLHVDAGAVVLHGENNIIFFSSRADPDRAALNLRILRNPMDNRILHKRLQNNIKTRIALQFLRHIHLEGNGIVKVIIFDIDVDLDMLNFLTD